MHAAGVKCSGTENKNGGVDEERETESEGRIEDGVTKGFAALLRLETEGARLHEARVEIEIVRHHGRAKDSDGDVEHFLVAEKIEARNKAARRLVPKRARKKDFVGEAGSDGEDQSDDKRFEQTKSAPLQQKHDENVHRRENDAEKKRNVK